MARQDSSEGSERLAALVNRASSLLDSALSPRTKQQYQRVWNSFLRFVHSTLGVSPLPASPSTVALFISHLVSPPSPSAPASVASAISAIAYFHKMRGLEDPTSSFLCRKILKGLAKTRSSEDMRVPITLPSLQLLLLAVQQVAEPFYQAPLFRSMFAVMFSAFLRLGEVTQSPHNILFHQVSFSSTSVTISFLSYKHHDPSHPFTLSLPSAPASPACPVRLVNLFCQVRGSDPGPFFCNQDGSPVTPAAFRKLLATAQSQAGLKDIHITPHSFRIGAATYAATKGYTSQQIQNMGRWRSAAFQKYIRVPSIQLP